MLSSRKLRQPAHAARSGPSSSSKRALVQQALDTPSARHHEIITEARLLQLTAWRSRTPAQRARTDRMCASSVCSTRGASTISRIIAARLPQPTATDESVDVARATHTCQGPNGCSDGAWV